MSSSADAAIPKVVSMVIFPTPSLQLFAAMHVSNRNQKENYRQGYIDQILHPRLPLLNLDLAQALEFPEIPLRRFAFSLERTPHH
jgi:hypothetical protein